MFLSNKVKTERKFYNEIKNRYAKKDSEFFEKLREQNQTNAEKSNRALLWACNIGDIEIAELLLKHDASVNCIWYSGISLLGHVCNTLGELTATACLLLQYGANPNHVDLNGHTPLSIACRCRHTEIAKLLLEHGVNPNWLDYSKQSPLHWVCDHGNIDIAKLLIQYEADLDLKDGNGETPLSIALARGHADIVLLLEQSGAKTYLLNENGEDALYTACLYRRSNEAKRLIEREEELHEHSIDDKFTM